jgi:CheY-like chemotaxis protein
VDVKEGRPHLDLVPGRYAQLTIADTGRGMDEATLQHVFEPFFTTKGVGRGTGLGLAMVHGIVKQSGGTIVAESVRGRGATFRIFLPLLTSPAAVEEPGPVEVRHPNGHESILVVEDEEPVRRLTVSILKRAGYAVMDAPDGNSALALLAKASTPVDLLVTDVIMPFMTGVELAHHLAPRSAATRVLFMSGHTGTELVPQDISEPGTQYLAKPFTPAQLLLKVRELLDHQRS